MKLRNQLLKLPILFILTPILSSSQIWHCKNASVRIFSATPLEDIEAKTETGVLAFNEKTAKILARVQIRSFNFRKKMMQEHFNENYMESDKYPFAEFDGTIQDMPSHVTVGSSQIHLKGTLNLHGVKKEVDLPATLIVTKEGTIEGKSTFKIKCADYNIEIPRLVVKNIAEEIEITIQAIFIPHKK